VFLKEKAFAIVMNIVHANNFLTDYNRNKRFQLPSLKSKSMKTIGIFCGGFSSEWEISLKSAQTIQDNFPKEFKTVKIVVEKSGWKALVDDQYFPFDLNTMTFQSGSEIKIDAAIVYVHGDPGENGKIQAFLEMKGIPYINSGPLASALSFDKWYCNQFIKGFGIKVAGSLFLTSAVQYSPSEIIDKLGLPVFVKPSDSGSSYGISKVKSKDEMDQALNNALLLSLFWMVLKLHVVFTEGKMEFMLYR
jgi:D-alanine-D-alanine ligase